MNLCRNLLDIKEPDEKIQGKKVRAGLLSLLLIVKSGLGK
jgi:hypothetical protein